MKYQYKILLFPKVTHTYHVPAFTEGTLQVIVNDHTFLDAQGILLVEFAIELSQWLSLVDAANPRDLYYSSMDFEEEPIVELKYDEEEKVYILRAVWADGTPPKIQVEHAIQAARDYIERLGNDLKVQYGIDLTVVIKNALT